MATSVQIPIAEYLETSYRPDREYIDGEIVERNMGSWEHGRVQALLSWWFIQNEPAWGVQVASEWRTRVSETRVRIPDVVLVLKGPQSRVLATPPILIIEILSPEDTYTETERRAADYQRMGVETIWIIDPETRTGRVCTGDTWTQATRLEVPGTPIYVELDTLFARL
jgi:Uma2 family endonuclease